jgi:DNA-binding IclR family transcriptional regulator
MEIIGVSRAAVTDSNNVPGRCMNPLNKVFLVLEAVVSSQGSGATYSDIVARGTLPKSSVYRILKDLSQLGYITYNPETKKYFGSLKLAALGAEVMAHFHLQNHVRPYLIELHRETLHTTNLGILDGTVGVFADKIQAQDYGIKLFSEIGKTFPLHCTGLGKILLAFSAQDVFLSLLDQPLESFTDRTITDRKDLEAELNLIRENGFAFDNEEITKGIKCVAAPVFGFNRELLGAISIAFLAAIENERSIDKEIAAIQKYGALISDSLSSMDIERQVV